MLTLFETITYIEYFKKKQNNYFCHVVVWYRRPNNTSVSTVNYDIKASEWCRVARNVTLTWSLYTVTENKMKTDCGWVLADCDAVFTLQLSEPTVTAMPIGSYAAFEMMSRPWRFFVMLLMSEPVLITNFFLTSRKTFLALCLIYAVNELDVWQEALQVVQLLVSGWQKQQQKIV
jgi:hypothetical protein